MTCIQIQMADKAKGRDSTDEMLYVVAARHAIEKRSITNII